MPTSGNKPELLVDTSVAVALVVSDHQFHQLTIESLDGRRLGLAGHAAFETFSVLTRLPPPARRTPAVVARLMTANFCENRFLSPEGATELLARFGEGEIAGGSVYDALVGATAVEHGLALATLDRRALDTYRVLGVSVEVLAPGRHQDLR
ncbi:MAG TPA: type II toxin-antitoxin system VapC family toxin [Acidimicrobiales bacterium]|nr:type II toxin-antitoxin system VapC family toxin [Acidimicrobiales bacterium]